ncbi:MAG: SRPBCC family protein [Anaerolineales bacterium]|nr:SRPBCC family protein [Anaerolineales bacterium]
MANFQISKSIDINRPAETVFQYVTDISQAPSWRPNLSVRDFSGEPFEVGTTWSEVTKFMGRDMVVNFEVTALEAGRHVETKQEGGGVSANLVWNFNPGTDNSSTFTLSFDGELSGWIAGLASGLLRNQAQKDMKRDFSNLKSNLESNQTPS